MRASEVLKFLFFTTLLFKSNIHLFAQKPVVVNRSLAVRYCSSCHTFPEPALLDKKTWTASVLPKMGWRLGVRKAGEDPFAELEPEEKERVRAAGIYPDKPLIALADWQKLVAYYEQQAPEKLPDIPPAPPSSNQLDSLFQIIPVSLGDNIIPQVSLLAFDAPKKELYIGDAGKQLIRLDHQLQLNGYWMLNGPPADIFFRQNRAPRLLSVGSIAPTEQKNGHLFTLDSVPSDLPDDVIRTELARPVHLAVADLDDDKVPDEVVCEFGHHTGKLVAHLSSIGPVVLKELPGARKTILTDLDKDGNTDILLLLAQARESVIWFRNEGKGTFTEKELLSFHPLYGCSDLQLHDFNRDGHPDLLLSNGDNWDISPIRKNYHGVRIFLNNQNLNFKEAFFFPMYGASKAIPIDADMDGDTDIAAISFYDDAASFVLLKNEGKNRFVPATHTQLPAGKWLTMDMGDMEGDGDPDIFLGSYFHNALEVTKTATTGQLEFPHVMILKNKSIQ